MITLSLNSKLKRIGHKIMDFSKLVEISPLMLLDVIKADNRLVLDEECRYLLESQKKNKGVCKYIIKISDYRKQKYEELSNSVFLTDSDNLLMGNQETYYRLFRSDLRYGV
jgi:hypothetical protein